MFGMSRNAVYDWFRRNDKLSSIPLESISVSDIPSSDINKFMDDEELLTMVNLAISSMPEKRKQIFRMSRIMGMKNREISDTLGISIKTVEYNIRKAQEELRKLMSIIVLFF